MAVKSLPFITPGILAIDELPGGKTELKNYWSKLSVKKSKYEWVSAVEESITVIIKEEMTEAAYINLKNVIEKFVDNYLLILDGKYEDFGMSVLHLWMGYIPEDLSTDEELQIFAEDLEKCYNSSDTDNLFVNLTTLVITRYLEAVVNFMNESSHDVINLFHCLYIQQTDSRFLMFKYNNNVSENLIPIQPSLNGLTVDRLRLDLAEFIKTNYSQRPCLEDGVLRLLAGSSNIISLNEPTISLANNIRTLLGNSRSNNAKELFFTLHKLILYFTFEAIQKRLSKMEDKTWSVAIVLDSMNEATDIYNMLVNNS